MPAKAAIYLDANASAPLSEAAGAELLSLLGVEARAGSPRVLPNPSSPHIEGRRAKALLRRARERVAASLGADVKPEDLLFTSSGTEAAQAAIRAALEPALVRQQKPHWILTAGDHDAHVQMTSWLEARGGSVSVLGLTPQGAPDLAKLDALFRPETMLVSAIWANNETGVITDVGHLSRLCAAASVPLHLDGAQVWGKLLLDLRPEFAQFVSLSGHKIGALSGTGVLWCSSAAFKAAPLFPGHQEGGARGGTENLLGAVSLGAAASELAPAAWAERLAPLRDRLEREIDCRIQGTRIHGQGALRIANTTNLGFEGVEKAGLVAALDLAGYCVSPGSACASGITEPSRVLMSMGLSSAASRSAVRVSLSQDNHWEELEGFIVALRRAVENARRLGPQKAGA